MAIPRVRDLFLVFCAGAASFSTQAQTLDFERLDVPFYAGAYQSHAFHGDTLYIDTGKFFRRPPGGADWSEGWEEWLGGFNRMGRGPLTFSPEGTVYQGYELSFHSLSRDHGDSWHLVDYPAITIPLRVTGDTLVGTWNEAGYGIALSVDNGATWSPLPYLPNDDPTSAIPYGFGIVESESAFHQTRIVAMGKSTPSYSDDGGQTWTPAEGFSGPAPIRAWSLITVEGGPHAGTLVAAVMEFLPSGQTTRIWRTTDGAHWEILGEVFEPLYTVYLTTNKAGVLLAHETNNDRLSASVDGGETWVLLTPSVSNSLVGSIETEGVIRHLSVGPDDHVFATVSAPEGITGFYRSTAPLSEVPINIEAPRAIQTPTLRIFPNPGSGLVRVVVSDERPQTTCSLRVADLLGRVVSEAGPVSTVHEWVINTSLFRAGYYLAAVTCGEASLTETFTVVL